MRVRGGEWSGASLPGLRATALLLLVVAGVGAPLHGQVGQTVSGGNDPAIAAAVPALNVAPQGSGINDRTVAEQRAESFVRTWWEQPEVSGAASQTLTFAGKPDAAATNVPAGAVQPVVGAAPAADDRNQQIYYKGRLDFSLEGGWFPDNIPFVFDRLIGVYVRMPPLKYTLAPFMATVRWQMTDVGGPWIFRGNWEAGFSGSYTMIPRGPETRYFAYMMSIRRNFVQPRWRVVPYFEGRLGIGDINAKEPLGVLYAQGQDLTFTVMLDGGVRYHVNSRYAISGGLGYMHISNMYLSEPKYPNYGINVYGPMVGVQVSLRKPRRTTPE